VTTPPMLRQLRHDVWATEKLLERCRALSQEQLELTVPGTYGSIRRTLMHIVGASERYLTRFMTIPAPLMNEDGDSGTTLDEIAAHLPHIKDGVEKLFAGQEFDPDRVIRDPRRRPTDPPLFITAWVLVTQFAHHGSDHRAHIGTILGAHGLETPELDVWAYGHANDAVKEGS
jgi:uncharacterized damage-inducible protein DinB